MFLLHRIWTPLFVLISISTTCNNYSSESSEWISLFNGENLDGWTPKIKGLPYGEDPANTFRVDDGYLTVCYADSSMYYQFQDQFGHLFYEVPFESYTLKLEYRFLPGQCPGGKTWAYKNSGIMFHCQPPESMHMDQDFPISIEAQLLGGNSPNDERPTMNLCTPGTEVMISDSTLVNHCISSTSRTIYDTSWVAVELEVYKDSLVRHKVDNTIVLEYHSLRTGGDMIHISDSAIYIPERELSSGYISLQSESHPIQFRDILVKKHNIY